MIFKSLTTSTVLRYPGVIKGVTIAIAVLAWLSALTSGGITVSSVVADGTFTLFAVAFVLLVDRYYEQVVMALCLLIITLSFAVCVYFKILNTGPLFQLSLLAIILGGILLGGRGATIMMIYSTLGVIVGEWWLAEQGVARSEIIGGITTNMLILILGYIMVIFIAEVVRQGLAALAVERDHLQEVLTELEARRGREAEIVVAVAQASNELGNTSAEQARGAQEQAAAVAQVSSTATQLDEEVKRVAESAQQVSILAERAAQEASATLKLVDDWSANLGQIHKRVISVVERGEELSEGLQKIDAILDALISISKESHILSLNAAIEAAAAENTAAGQRFTIVASSIDELAGRAAVSTANVRNIIEQIRQAASASISATFESIVEMERGVMLLQDTGERAKQLEQMAADTSQAVGAIFASTAEQRQGSQQVAISMQQISNIVQESAKSEEHLASIVARLHGLVAMLNDNGQLTSTSRSLYLAATESRIATS